MPAEGCVAIVDARERMREAAESLFRSMGFRPVSFATAEEFLHADEAASATCLALDMQTPGVTGSALEKHAAATGHRIPIVFVTGDPATGVRALTSKTGALCFLTGPISES